jgi:murein DD-endopeptidase MepM/ murein hydrolase activator NlpD
VQVRIALVTLLLAAAGVVAATVAQAGSPARATAQATAITGSLGTYGAVQASGDRRAGETFSLDARGVQAATVSTSAIAARSASTPSGQAEASARSLRLLDGLVTARAATRKAVATPAGRSWSGRVSGLRVGDRRIGTVTGPRTLALPDGAGSVAVNRGAAALVVTLRRAANGFSAGTTVTVAQVTAGARAARADRPSRSAPAPKPRAPRKPRSGRSPKAQRSPEAERAPRPARSRERSRGTRSAKPRVSAEERARRRAERRAEAQRRREDAAAVKRLKAGEFVFPVYGTAVTLADDYGAPRQPVIGTHQGNDIFGPLGAPVLAVADGTVEKVGTLSISGNRLWLRTDDNDTFFYAHLASFAPAASDGNRVRAGDLLGFVGNTGDAEPTPPHLHFEIHPDDARPIDPHEVLAAWQEREPPRRSWLARYGDEPAPGALVAVDDFIAE